MIVVISMPPAMRMKWGLGDGTGRGAPIAQTKQGVQGHAAQNLDDIGEQDRAEQEWPGEGHKKRTATRSGPTSPEDYAKYDGPSQRVR
jgi:hypothetical protein